MIDKPVLGDLCPVHRTIHGAHGWYWCAPDGSGIWTTDDHGRGPIYWVPKVIEDELG